MMMMSRCSEEAGSRPGWAGGQPGTGGQTRSGGRPMAARAEAGPGHSNPDTQGRPATENCLQIRKVTWSDLNSFAQANALCERMGV